MNKILKYLSFGCVGLLIPVMAGATLLEKIYGSQFTRDYIYVSLPVIILWGIASLASIFYICRKHLYRRPATFCLHLSLIVILAGAFVTHVSGHQGKIHLRMGELPLSEFILSDSTSFPLPFSMTLKEFHPEYYPGTFSPSDFISSFTISDKGTAIEGIVSMNNIFTYRSFRFYQSGYDADGNGTILSVASDPYGIAVTYTGYVWLLLSIIAFFFERKTEFRHLLKSPFMRKGVLGVASLLFVSASAHSLPRTLPEDVASKFCDLYVYYGDRVAPLHTVARDFTVKIYGKSSYHGLTPEQVLTGWFFYYDDWKHEPFIKIKSGEVASLLKIEGKYARLTDFTDIDGYRLEVALRNGDSLGRNAGDANEKFNLISSLATGSLLKIYPYFDLSCDNLQWYSIIDPTDENMPYEQWLFIRNSMGLVAEKIALGDFAGASGLLEKIRKYQIKEGGDRLPSRHKINAEIFYNSTNADKVLAMICLTAGVIAFIILINFMVKRRCLPGFLIIIFNVGLMALFAYLTMRLSLRWYVSGHIPLSNGFETMQFMAWMSALLTLLLQRRYPLVYAFGYLLCGAALLVAMMGESSPQITNLMPVLRSPLLSFHVMVVMTAYALFGFIMLNGIAALLTGRTGEDRNSTGRRLQDISSFLLYPAVFLLALGIFVGAVWANVSWGRYWGWDPKEVWALITFLLYAAPLHSHSLTWFRNPTFFHVYCIMAFLSVITTYFGVNFILGGMHSYA